MTAIPTQRHPAADWPEAQRRRWAPWSFCPCGTEIPFSQPHCTDAECIRIHNTAEHLLDLMGESDD